MATNYYPQYSLLATVSNAGIFPVQITSSLIFTAHDYMFLSYTSLGLTRVEYKSGGSGGTTVAVLTLGYSSTSLTSVTRS